MTDNTQLADVLRELQFLKDKVADIEGKLMLVPDIERYGKLQQALSIGDLKGADLQTTAVILETAGKNRETLTPEDMSTFPCNVLMVIDRLWKTYSHDRFGFSVQLALYQSAGGSINSLRRQDMEVLRKFGEQVGWRENEEWVIRSTYDTWDFSLSRSPGSFPAAWWDSPYGVKMVTFCFLRLLECNLTQ
ncbi:MAG: hypothetical protein N5P05_000623 [Chroococcopsis gigantea SAG 12.99]|jgi:hypothetical protein|nr:hypothetical protein [Chroococcopsis gigantea SAG 12.99]